MEVHLHTWWVNFALFALVPDFAAHVEDASSNFLNVDDVLLEALFVTTFLKVGAAAQGVVFKVDLVRIWNHALIVSL